MSFGDEFRLTLITNDPGLAAKADHIGINRIGLDLEQLGKAERQEGQESPPVQAQSGRPCRHCQIA